jgi:cytochrome c oxidase subunit 2
MWPRANGRAAATKALRIDQAFASGGRGGDALPCQAANRVEGAGTVTDFAKRLSGAAAATATMLWAGAAQAAPQGWGTYLQEAASTIAEDIHAFGALTFWIITPITLLVLVLLVVVMVRFNARANPVPSRTSHNTAIEVIWTVAPILILLVIAVPSFRLLYEEQTIPEADLTVKATGNKWYWSYEYPDAEGFAFDSYMVEDASSQVRLLQADYPLVVPVDSVVRLQITGSDVLHAFAMPALGVKIDAIPGRLNEGWFRATRTGVFYGQCSELCGRNHAYMPIEMHIVTQEQYTAWLEAAKTDIDAGKALLATFTDGTAPAEEVASR